MQIVAYTNKILFESRLSDEAIIKQALKIIVFCSHFKMKLRNVISFLCRISTKIKYAVDSFLLINKISMFFFLLLIWQILYSIVNMLWYDFIIG